MDQSHLGGVSAVGPPCEAAFHAYKADGRLDGKPRPARRYTTDTTCPLPTPEDRLLCSLVSLKTSPLSVVQGRLFRMDQSTAHQWMYALWVALRATRRALGEAPTRSVQALAPRQGLAEADALAVVEPTGARPADLPPAAAVSLPAAPLLATMAPHGASHAPRIRLSQRAVIVARKRAPRAKTGG